MKQSEVRKEERETESPSKKKRKKFRLRGKIHWRRSHDLIMK